MARKYITEVNEESAVRIKINVTDMEEYKRVWLILTNNQKAQPEDFLRVYNDYGNGIYVITKEENKEQMVDWLKQFTEDVTSEPIIVARVNTTCDYDNFDKDYADIEYVFEGDN